MSMNLRRGRRESRKRKKTQLPLKNDHAVSWHMAGAQLAVVVRIATRATRKWRHGVKLGRQDSKENDEPANRSIWQWSERCGLTPNNKTERIFRNRKRLIVALSWQPSKQTNSIQRLSQTQIYTALDDSMHSETQKFSTSAAGTFCITLGIWKHFRRIGMSKTLSSRSCKKFKPSSIQLCINSYLSVSVECVAANQRLQQITAFVAPTRSRRRSVTRQHCPRNYERDPPNFSGL